MNEDKFRDLVEKAVVSLPEEYAARLENVDIVIEDWPTRNQSSKARIRHDETLLGLYEGVPITDRTGGYGFVPPDKITIFQKPIELKCRNEREIEAEVRATVIHEIGHFFGISDARLDELGR
jgi:predicted Zn-dependent protease with MMP-like domain